MTLDSLDVKQMKLLLALLEERNLTRVATKLSVSQQAVSEQLKKLRQAFDDKLFVRAKNGVVPTPFADELGIILRDVVGKLESMREPTEFNPRCVTQTYVIAASEYAQMVLLAELVRQLRIKSPHIRLIIKPISEEAIEKSLAQGQLDLVLCEEHQVPPTLAKTKLLHDEYVCVSSKPAAREKRGIGDHSHLVLTRHQSQNDKYIMQWLSKKGLDDCTTLTVPSYSVAPSFIAAYDAMALLPSRLLPDDHLQIVHTEDLPPGFNLVAAWHTRAAQDPLHRWIMQSLGTICDEKIRPSLPASA